MSFDLKWENQTAVFIRGINTCAAELQSTSDSDDATCLYPDSDSCMSCNITAAFTSSDKQLQAWNSAGRVVSGSHWPAAASSPGLQPSGRWAPSLRTPPLSPAGSRCPWSGSSLSSGMGLLPPQGPPPCWTVSVRTAPEAPAIWAEHAARETDKAAPSAGGPAESGGRCAADDACFLRMVNEWISAVSTDGAAAVWPLQRVTHTHTHWTAAITTCDYNLLFYTTTLLTTRSVTNHIHIEVLNEIKLLYIHQK